MKNHAKTILIATGALIAGVFIGLAMNRSQTNAHRHEWQTEVSGESVWTCSMHPQVRRNEPGQCPICGMDLIPVGTDRSSEEPLAIRMSPTAMKLAQVQTSPVGHRGVAKTIRLSGKVQPNERLLRTQASHVSGRIERLLVDFTGQYIRQGTRLADIYSPDLVSAQQELIVAARLKDEQPGIYRSAREKLRNWKLRNEEIDALEKNEQADGIFPIYSNTDGYVLERKVEQGDYINKGQSLFEIADLSTLWVLFDVYESDLQGIHTDDRVEITVGALPGRTWTGTINYIDPVIDPQTRVARARAEVRNTDLSLKPEMFTSGVVFSPPDDSRELTVPKSAVLWTGKRSIVYVKNEDENGVYFLLRELELGADLGNSYAVRSGLSHGEEVATHGAFSIDAAAQLSGKPSMMSPEGSPAPQTHSHGNEHPGSSGERNAPREH